MKVRETCGCGASIEVEGSTSDTAYESRVWRRDHRHDSRCPASTETGERREDAPMVLEHDPRSTTASESERAEPFGFGVREDEVMA